MAGARVYERLEALVDKFAAHHRIHPHVACNLVAAGPRFPAGWPADHVFSRPYQTPVRTQVGADNAKARRSLGEAMVERPDHAEHVRVLLVGKPALRIPVKEEREGLDLIVRFRVEKFVNLRLLV